MAEVQARKPRLMGTYKRFKLGEHLFYTVPWLVMGFGIIIGGTAGVEYFHPCNGNIFVIAFWSTVFLPLIFMVVWVWFFGGGSTLVILMRIDRPGF